jgi:hypothetical protein
MSFVDLADILRRHLGPLAGSDDMLTNHTPAWCQTAA